ncbi:hypothetical protein GR254_10515, partial [Mycobacterium tuberculosis]|nr:hypothetical protein [Mycobacterium tuberculosis]
PHPGEPGSQRWLSYTANNREYALLLRHPEPRPLPGVYKSAPRRHSQTRTCSNPGHL